MVQQTSEYEKILEYENAHFLLSLLAGDINLAQEIGKNFDVRAVSYTHLTLPTICSV